MVKKLSIVAAFLIIIGIIGSVTTYARVSKGDFSTKLSDSFTNIQIDVGDIDMEIMPTSHDARVELKGIRAEKISKHLDVDIANDTLSIQLDVKNEKWLQVNIFSDVKLKIYLPEKIYDSININGNAADLYVVDLSANSLEIDLKTGDFFGENLDTDTLSAKSRVGDILLRDVNGDVSATLTTGDMKLSRITGSEIQAITKTGDMSFTNISGKLTAETTYGEVIMSHNEIQEPISIKSKVGDIVVHANEVPENAQFDAYTKVGDILIFGQKRRTTNISNEGILIELVTTTGDIVVKKK